MSGDLIRPQSRHSLTCVNRVAFLEEILQEFVEITVHSILFHRQVYPEGTFKGKRKYRVPIYTCVHPEVKGYIQRVTKCLNSRIAGGSVNNVQVLLYAGKESERRIVEEYRFRFHVETGSSRPSELSLREIGLEEIEESLRAFLLRLSSLKSSLKPLQSGGEDCGFEIEIETNSLLADELENPRRLDQLFWVHPQLEDVGGEPLKGKAGGFDKNRTKASAAVVPVGTFASRKAGFSVVSYLKEHRDRKTKNHRDDEKEEDDFDADAIIRRYFASSSERGEGKEERRAETPFEGIKETTETREEEALIRQLKEEKTENFARESGQAEGAIGGSDEELSDRESWPNESGGKIPKTLDRTKIKNSIERESLATERTRAREVGQPDGFTRAFGDINSTIQANVPSLFGKSSIGATSPKPTTFAQPVTSTLCDPFSLSTASP